jgi:hypothetical protein
MSELVDANQGKTFSDIVSAVGREGQLGNEGKVILKGTFDFGSNSLNVSGLQQPIIICADPTDAQNNTYPVIQHGGGLDTSTTPASLRGAVVVNSSQQQVTLQNLRFENASGVAIQAKAVTNLMIDHCFIQNVTPLQITSGGATFNSSGGIAVSEGASGSILIQNNEISVGGSSTDRTFGIQINRKNMGGPASITVSGNTITNTTAHGIVLRDINRLDNTMNPPGPISVRATVEGNTIVTGKVGGKPKVSVDTFVDGIFCQGAGVYVVQNNPLIHCAGIRLAGTPSATLTGAVIEGNTVKMSFPVKYSPYSEAPRGAQPSPYFPNTVINDNEGGTILDYGIKTQANGYTPPKEEAYPFAV